MEQLFEGIWRVKIPFEDIFTSAFILTEQENAVILDSGSSNADAERFVIPAAGELGVSVEFILCSHQHGDHAGGFSALQRSFPAAKAAASGEAMLGRYEVLPLPGHTPDCIGIFDRVSRALISCDSLQLCGIGRYGTFFTDFDAYLAAIERVRQLAPAAIIASHDYVPLGSIAAGGGVSDYLNECKRAAMEIARFAAEFPDPEEAALRYNAAFSLPPVSSEVMRAAGKRLRQ